MARKYTNKLCDMLDQGLVSNESVVNMCLKYMSEDDVKDMMEANELTDYEDEEQGDD